MNIRYFALVLAILFGVHPASAQTRTVWAEVTGVTPVLQTRTAPPRSPACHAPAPARQAGLAALLQWDLQPACRPQQVSVTSHYRVDYTWAGRTYSHTSKTVPGHKIRLSVAIDPDPAR